MMQLISENISDWKFDQSVGKRKKTGKNTPSESGATPKPETPAAPPAPVPEQNGESTENGETGGDNPEEDTEPEPPKTVSISILRYILCMIALAF